MGKQKLKLSKFQISLIEIKRTESGFCLYLIRIDYLDAKFSLKSRSLFRLWNGKEQVYIKGFFINKHFIYNK